MKEIKLKAAAKINLMLDILGILPNGYHDLFMIMQTVSLYDEITVSLNETNELTCSCDCADIPTDERNIVIKAAKAFFEYFHVDVCGVHIDIKKSIPHEAGLAGGSTDGAAVVIALKKLLYPSLSDRQVIEICSTFGSDVAFCSVGGTMAAQGTGNVLTYLPQLKLPYLIIVKPDCSVSTGAAYSSFDTADNIIHCDVKGMMNACINQDYSGVYSRISNTFEQFILVPQRVDIKSVMRKHNALASCMSGSGPSVFGIFENENDANLCYQELIDKYPNTFLCHSTDKGIYEI